MADTNEKEGPVPRLQKQQTYVIDAAQAQEVAEDELPVLEKFALWETKTRLYIIGCNVAESRYRVLKIDRTLEPEEGLSLTEDPAVYSPAQIRELEQMIDVGNNGISKPLADFFHGIVGFVRFTAGWYIVLVTKRTTVALLGGHYVYNCVQSAMISVDPRPDKSSEEQRLLSVFQQMDLSKNFYFSNTYDLTSTLQYNMTKPVNDERPRFRTSWGFNDKYIWNKHLLNNGFPDTSKPNPWVTPLIYGSADQAKINIYGDPIFVTLIGRRSRHFAGARFMKRGVTAEGSVANEVEIEQIASENVTTPFWCPLGRFESAPSSDADQHKTKRKAKANPKYTSFVQLRGSVPIYWMQNASNMQTKPPIDLSFVDPYYSAAARHFDDLFARYGTPVIVYNLVKNEGRELRETKLLRQFDECVRYLNQSLPEEHHIIYKAFDIANANKKHTEDVIDRLESDARDCLATVGFFHSGPHPAAYEGSRTKSEPYRSTMSLQRGTLRTNCVDCIDRTNAAQFVTGKIALGRQLRALGALPDGNIHWSSAANDLLTEVYHDLGDILALQYGGSHLVCVSFNTPISFAALDVIGSNTIHSYETQHPGQWRSHSRDTLNGIKRYYANSFSDTEKQRSINLFLGTSDRDPLTRPANLQRRSYIRWYSPENIERPLTIEDAQLRAAIHASREPDLWLNYYRQAVATRFEGLFAYRIHGTMQLKAKENQHDSNDPRELSPFLPHVSGASKSRRKAINDLVERQTADLLCWKSDSAKPRRTLWNRQQRNEKVKRLNAPQPGSSAALALQNENPTVDQPLSAEYDKYVQQAIIVSHDDRQIYSSSIKTNQPLHAMNPSHRAYSIYQDATDLQGLFPTARHS